MPIGKSLLPEFDQEMANTRKVLERCPEDKFGWKPHAKSFAMGSLATHIVNMVGWGVDTLQKDSFDIQPPGAPPYEEKPIATQKALLETFDKNRDAFRGAIDAASDQQMMTDWSLLNGGQPLFTMPRAAIIRGMLLNHIIHHRGQLTVYLRLNDVPVPGVYGPSADES